MRTSTVLPRPEQSRENTSNSEPTFSTAEDKKPTPEPTILGAVDTYEGPSLATLSGTPELSGKQSSGGDSLHPQQTLAVDNNLTGSQITRMQGPGSSRQQSRKTRLFVWGYVISSIPSWCGMFIPLTTRPRVLVQLQSLREKVDCRLGLSNFPKTTLSDVPFPVELHIPGVNVVGLAVSGRSVWILFLAKNMPSCFFAAEYQ